MRLLLLLSAAILGTLPGMAGGPAGPRAPRLLSQTGLYLAPGRIDTRNRAYAPQYPLWSDGAAKSRWVRLPEGAAIDGRNEDAWSFPVGTKFWKEFRFHGRKVETRFLWHARPGTWIFASYAWNDAQTEATLVPAAGLPDVAEVAPGLRHSIPGTEDCRTCHGNGRTEVLGFTALQLSPDRDPRAIHGEPLRAGMLTLADLVAEGRLRHARPDLLARPPRIRAADPDARALLGYFAVNCGACHRTDHPIEGLDLDFRHTALGSGEPGLASIVDRPSQYPLPGEAPGSSRRLVPGDPDRSVVAYRMASRRPASQMPPLGSVLGDQEALARLRAWIAAGAPSR
jgi:mono/diheme cytochrome c family protein